MQKLERFKNRKGAILALTAVMLLVLIATAAVSLDASRLHAARNELRTSADAAALAGAQQLLKGAATAENVTRTLAVANRTLGKNVEVQQIRYGIWQPATRTFVPTIQTAADAIEVTVRQNTQSMLPSLFGKEDIGVTAKAIAWSGAPVDGAKCVKPFALLHEDFMVALGKPHWADLTQEDIQRLRDTATTKHYLTLNMGNSYGPPNRGEWFAVQLPPVESQGKVLGEDMGGRPIADNVAGCTFVRNGDLVITQPGKQVGNFTEGMQRMCQPLTEAGKCMSADGTVGVPVAVAIYCRGPELTGGGHMWLEVHYVAAFMLTDYISQGTDAGKVKGYLINFPGEGTITTSPSPVTKTILVG